MSKTPEMIHKVNIIVFFASFFCVVTVNSQSVIGQLEKLASQKSDNTAIINRKDTLSFNNSSSFFTNFFGYTMPFENIQTLVNPETNENIADVFLSKKFMEQKVSADSLKISQLFLKSASETQSICFDFVQRLKSSLDQRNQFYKLVIKNKQLIDIWSSANKVAMEKATQEGLKEYANQLSINFFNKETAADKLQAVLDKYSKIMAKHGVNVDSLQVKINDLRVLYSTKNLANLVSKMNNWQDFIVNEIPEMQLNLQDTSITINEIFEDKNIQKYLQTDKQAIEQLMDNSSILFINSELTKWATKKLPKMGLVALSTAQTYKGYDWQASLQQLLTSQQINGGMLDTAKYIQNNIDNSYNHLSDCEKQ